MADGFIISYLYILIGYMALIIGYLDMTYD
ncbi:Uncharacterised protein [marine metagenome]